MNSPILESLNMCYAIAIVIVNPNISSQENSLLSGKMNITKIQLRIQRSSSWVVSRQLDDLCHIYLGFCDDQHRETWYSNVLPVGRLTRFHWSCLKALQRSLQRALHSQSGSASIFSCESFGLPATIPNYTM